MTDTEPLKPSRLDRVEATIAAWVQEPRILLDTAVTVVSALVAYHLTDNVAVSTLVGLGVGNLLPPAARQIDNNAAAGNTPNGHYAQQADERSFVEKLANVLKTGRVKDANQGDTVPIERAPRKD